jgi:hypothetical protein
MPSRFHCGLPKPAAFKVAGKPFLASGLCGRASGQQATADRRPLRDIARNFLSPDLRGRF